MPQDKRGNFTFSVGVKWRLLGDVSCCILTDAKEPLVPPRFLERFNNRKVKQGTSITLSVKVEGLWFVGVTLTLIWDPF